MPDDLRGQRERQLEAEARNLLDLSMPELPLWGLEITEQHEGSVVIFEQNKNKEG